MIAPQVPAEVRALLAECRLRLFAQARFTASTRRPVGTTIRNCTATKEN